VLFRSEVVPAFENELLHVRDEKAANTEGGESTAGVANIRVLNTVKTNEISGASVATNQITLPAGTYHLKARAPVYTGDLHKALLRNVTDSTNVLIGSNAYTLYPTGGENNSFIEGRFTIAAQKVFEIHTWVAQGRGTNGLGVKCNLNSMVEVYTEVYIWKVA
jgi:hypothetical protein